jgi:hypothetical protein
MKFTIDRTKWLRGEGVEKSYLLRECDGKMCCLGQFAIFCGLDPERITNVDSPDMVPVSHDESAAVVWETHNRAAGFLFRDNYDTSSVCSDLMEANDEISTDDLDREREIIKLFAKGGIEVEFTG